MSAGISISVDAAEFGPAVAKLAALARFDASDLMSAIGALGESQTRRRIESEKTAPDGSPWPPNHTGSSILLESGQHLLGSIAWIASGDEALWGSSWQFAHVHQDGAVIKAKAAPSLAFMLGGSFVLAKQVTIPARPFIGLSDENRQEIVDLVTDVFGGLIR